MAAPESCSSCRPGPKRCSRFAFQTRWRSTQLRETGTVVVSGRSVGEKIGKGTSARHSLGRSPRAISRGGSPGHRQDRSRLGTDNEEGGSHRYQSRRPDVPCRHRQPRIGPALPLLGPGNGTELLRDGQEVTVSCAEGETGHVYAGLLPFDVERVQLQNLARPKTKIMMNVANPEEAFRLSMIPNDGVGLAREEFIITTYIKVHPLALLHYNELDDSAARAEIDRLTVGYADKAQYFVDKLAEGVAMIAAAFYPKDVIVRLSDFKTNEYANLVGGRKYEPTEENPMLGFRGASRYYSPRYRDGFALECRAMTKVRDEMGLVNVKLMIPFCRTVRGRAQRHRRNGAQRAETRR